MGDAFTFFLEQTIKELPTWVFWAIIGIKLLFQASFKASWVIFSCVFSTITCTLVHNSIVSPFLTAKPIQEFLLSDGMILIKFTIFVVPETRVPELPSHPIAFTPQIAFLVRVVQVTTHFKGKSWVVLDTRKPFFKFYWICLTTFTKPVAIVPRNINNSTAIVLQITIFEFITSIFTCWYTARMTFEPSVKVVMVVFIWCM